VTLKYGAVTAIADLRCSLAPAEFAFVLGPSGAGKTSLLKMIIGQVRPTAGQLWVDEVPMHRASGRRVQRLRRRMGVVFEDHKLLEHKTALENVAFALEVADPSLPGDEARRLALSQLRRVGLQRRAGSFPAQLSAGQRQRVAVARALVARPKLLIADEPTANLDAVWADRVIDLMRRAARMGSTVLVATHDRDQAERTPATLLTLRGGRLLREQRLLRRAVRVVA
jgi:cell division transport system ATP-binding protein